MYGSTPLEDLVNLGTIVRFLTEWTATNVQGIMDQTSIAEGIGGYTLDSDGTYFGLVNTRKKYIQSTTGTVTPGTAANFSGGATIGPSGAVSGSNTTQRYQVSLPFGLMTQSNLIPTKFMASALAIELTLEAAERCMYVTTTATDLGEAVAYATAPSYSLSEVNLIPEVIQFDASYDAMFLKGLRENGV